jgi:hypothetical protein
LKKHPLIKDVTVHIESKIWNGKISLKMSVHARNPAVFPTMELQPLTSGTGSHTLSSVNVGTNTVTFDTVPMDFLTRPGGTDVVVSVNGLLSQCMGGDNACSFQYIDSSAEVTSVSCATTANRLYPCTGDICSITGECFFFFCLFFPFFPLFPFFYFVSC